MQRSSKTQSKPPVTSEQPIPQPDVTSLVAEPAQQPDRRTVDQLNLIGVTIERDGTLTYANPYTVRVTAWQADEIVGKNFFDIFIPATDRARLELDFDDLLVRGRLPENREISLLTRSGALRNVQLNSLLVERDERSSEIITAITLIGEDITNKRRVASALSNTNAQLQDLVDNTSDLIQLLTLDGKFIFVNRAWREVLGYASSEIASLNLRDVLHPDYVDTTLRMLKRIEGGRCCRTLKRFFATNRGKRFSCRGASTAGSTTGAPRLSAVFCTTPPAGYGPKNRRSCTIASLTGPSTRPTSTISTRRFIRNWAISSTRATSLSRSTIRAKPTCRFPTTSMNTSATACALRSVGWATV
nr:PAS domain-containing protein [Spirosoma rhododendri]